MSGYVCLGCVELVCFSFFVLGSVMLPYVLLCWLCLVSFGLCYVNAQYFELR
jgi:hypothetical protein